MTRIIKESMVALVGVADGVPYQPLSPRYARRKANAGGPAGRPLWFHSRLAGSWRIIRISRGKVVVGPGGGKVNITKANAHDGGLADHLGKPELNRLRLGFNDKLLDSLGSIFLDRVMENADKRTPKRG
jgi:hypothetical protein